MNITLYYKIDNEVNDAERRSLPWIIHVVNAITRILRKCRYTAEKAMCRGRQGLEWRGHKPGGAGQAAGAGKGKE